MQEKTQQLINELNKDEFLAFYAEDIEEPLKQFFEEYSIYIPLDRANDMSKEQFMYVFLATQFRNISNYVRNNEVYLNCQWKLDSLNTKKIVNYIKQGIYYYLDKYKDRLILAVTEKTTTMGDDEEEIWIRIRLFYFGLSPTFIAKYSLSGSYTIPNYCFRKIEDMEEEDFYSAGNLDQRKLLTRAIDRRYKVTSNMPIYTNELNNKTKIYTIMDKNIMRSFDDVCYTSAFYSRRCVLLNPNLTHFVEEIKKTIPIEHLLALFDYEPKEILKLLKKVSYIKDTFVFIGLGGLVSNFLFWCERLRDYFDLDYVFKNIVISEPDDLEFSNLFRIPLNWKDIKLNVSINDPIIADLTLSHRNSNVEYSNIHKEVSKLALVKSIRNISPKIRTYPEKFTRINLKNCILIGGPDLDTRISIYDKYFEDENIHFLCTTHANNTVSIDTFPNFDRELVVETYGNIDLNKFLLNMFKMSIELIKILANKTYIENRQSNLLEYSVDNEDFIANSKKHKCLKDIAYAIN